MLFRDKYEKLWNLNLILGNCPPISKLIHSCHSAARSAAKKTEGLKKILNEKKFKGIISGIRRDEQNTRVKEEALVQETRQCMGCKKSTSRTME